MLAVGGHLADGTAEIAVVTFTRADLARRYRDDLGIDVTVVVDPDRSAYSAYGLERARLSRVWGWRAFRAYAAIVRERGPARLRRPVDDTRQLGGDFVIDREGRLAWAYRGQGPEDRPTAAQVAAQVRSVA